MRNLDNKIPKEEQTSWKLKWYDWLPSDKNVKLYEERNQNVPQEFRSQYEIRKTFLEIYNWTATALLAGGIYLILEEICKGK